MVKKNYIDIKGQKISLEKFQNNTTDFSEPINNIIDTIVCDDKQDMLLTFDKLKDFDNLGAYLSCEYGAEVCTIYCNNSRTPFGFIVNNDYIITPDSININGVRVYAY